MIRQSGNQIQFQLFLAAVIRMQIKKQCFFPENVKLLKLLKNIYRSFILKMHRPLSYFPFSKALIINTANKNKLYLLFMFRTFTVQPLNACISPY